MDTDRGLRVALGLMLAGQVVVYLLYGEETFLDGLHVAPLLILAAATSAKTTVTIVLGVAVVLTAVLAFNNASQLMKAMQFFEWVEQVWQRS